MEDDIKTFQSHFQQNIQNIKEGPIQQRPCTDILCLIVFLILTSAFIFIGINIIRHADFHQTLISSQDIPSIINIDPIKKSIWLILGITCFTIILSIILVLLITAFPQCIVYTLILLSVLSLLGFGIMFIYSKSYLIGCVILSCLLGWAFLLYCLWDSIDKGVNLLSATGRFMLQKPTVFVAPFVVGLIMLIFASFWLVSFYGIYLIPDLNNYYQSILTISWIIIGVFYTYLLYYVMVFLIATCASFWYYGNYQSNYVCTGLKWIVLSHLGSLTLASIMITLLTILRYSSEKATAASTSTNPCHKCITSMVTCCIQSVQSLVSVLNHNSVIVMSITGQNYVNAAQSSMALVYKNYQLFVIADAIGVLVGVFGTVVIVGIPSLVGYLVISNRTDFIEDDLMTVMGAIIALSISVSILFVNILTQSLSSMFILQCLNEKFLQIGIKLVNSILPQLNALLSEMNILKGQNGNGGMIPLTTMKRNDGYQQSNSNQYNQYNPPSNFNQSNNPYDMRPNFNQSNDLRSYQY